MSREYILRKCLVDVLEGGYILKVMALTFALLVFASESTPAVARTLRVDFEILHVNGMATIEELNSALADSRTTVEVTYSPIRLIEGITARRESILPIGSVLQPISVSRTLTSESFGHSTRGIQLELNEHPPAQSNYRIQNVSLHLPIRPGLARPQPELEIMLLDSVPSIGFFEKAWYKRGGAFDLGLRVQYHWSDAKTDAVLLNNDPDARLLNGAYRFRPRHRHAGLFEFLAPIVSSDPLPPARSPLGQRSFRMREPFPETLKGLQLSRNHLVQVRLEGTTVERLSIYGEKSGPGLCQSTQGYDALFSRGKLVELEVSSSGTECDGRSQDLVNRRIRAGWQEDGNLLFLITQSTKWDSFSGENSPAPNMVPVETELQRIRAAFLQ